MSVKTIRNWWLLTVIGIGLVVLGIWVYKNPIENYVALSALFSAMIFVSGIMEVGFALSNRKIMKDWGWQLAGGLFDLIIGFVLITRPELSMLVLPIIFGIWLIFRGMIQVSRGFLLKQYQYAGWWWSVIGGILVIIFGFFVANNPLFGSITIVTWTSLSLIFLGILTVAFSFLVKRIQSWVDF